MLDMRPFPPLIHLITDSHFELYRRGLYGALTAFFICLISGPFIIRSLRSHRIRQVFRTRQQVRNLAVLHESKFGTPIMGGLIILLGALSSMLVWVSFNDLVIIAMCVYLSCTLLGIIDDSLKILYNSSRGIHGLFKLMVPALMVVMLYYIAKASPHLQHLLTYVDWEFLHAWTPRTVMIGIAVFYFFVIAGSCNAVNLTDGIDGLAVTNIMMCFVFFAFIAFSSCNFKMTEQSMLSYISGASELYVLCCCFAGACFGFCLFNLNPASIFMGDTGSIGLGGLLAIVAILLRQPFSLLLVGIIFVVEALSVMLQMTSKKIFRRKIFLMSPLHHHFELKGNSERRIVKVAFAIQCLCVLLTVAIIFYGPEYIH